MSEEISKYEVFNKYEEAKKLLLIDYDINKDKRYLVAISALEKQLNGGWIPVKKKLPDTNKDILVTLNDGKVVPARYLFADNLNHITAWQPLPEPYKEVENE